MEDLALPHQSFVEALLSWLEQVPEDVERTFGVDAEVIGPWKNSSARSEGHHLPDPAAAGYVPGGML